MPRASTPNQIAGLIAWLLASFAAAGVGGLASVNAAGFYGQLLQPSWAPPAWLFGPVWTLLFALMAISAWLVWREHGFRRARPALSIFITQLFVNAAWSWLFFVWHQGALALADIVVMWLLIVATISSFWRLQRLAALLLLPYLLWVSFAAALNLNLWHVNPALLG